MDLRDASDRIAAWAAGARCAGCGSSGSGVAALCARCLSALVATPPGPDAVYADVGVAGRLVRLGKSGTWRRAGRVLAGLALERVREGAIVLPAVDAVTWVPADRRRRAQRGGHLPERFARALARGLEVPAHATLVRTRAAPQRGLDRDARASNVVGAFALRPALTGQPVASVLLVDDVRTTGATFTAARLALGPVAVRVHTLAIVGVGLTPHGPAADGVEHTGRKVDHR